MSGPYPPPGYQRPSDDNGWWAGQQQHQQPQQQGQYDFPTVQYSGLAGQTGQPGWGGGGEPPERGSNTGRIIVAVLSVLVIIGGIVTGIVLVSQRHQAREAAPPATTNTPAIIAPTVGENEQQGSDTGTTTNPDDPGVPNGNTTLTLPEGACVTAQVNAEEQYTATQRVPCGSAQSDLILAAVTPDMTGCADHEYLRLSAPSAGVYCFTLDIKRGDCVDGNYLKRACAGAAFMVLNTEPGPGNSDSCASTAGATHWVPVGREPVQVGCLGPPKTS